MSDVFLLVEDEGECRTVVLGAYSTRRKANAERKRIYAERGTDEAIAQEAAYLRSIDATTYAYFHGKQTPERIARYRLERIVIHQMTIDAEAEV